MQTTDRGNVRAILLILIASCCFGSLTTLTVFTERSGLPLLPAMFWRYFLAVIIVLLALRRQVIDHLTSRHAWRLFVVGGLGQAVITYLSLRALDYLPVGPLAFLFYTYPAWVAIISAVSGREKLTTPRVIALVVAMTGIAVMVGLPKEGEMNTIGLILALGTALLYALYLPALHAVQEKLPAGVSTFYLLLGVVTAFFVASLFSGEIQVPNSLATWTNVLLLSVIGTTLAFGALISGLRVLGPVRTSIVSTVEPFFTALLGILLLGEALSRGTIIGGIMIAAAVIILEWTGREVTPPLAV